MAATSISISVDASRAVKKLKAYNKFIESRAKTVTRDLALLGRRYARRLAPRDTMELWRLIEVKKSQGNQSIIVSDNPLEGGKNRMFGKGRFPNFNLVRWMHETGGVFQSDNPFGKAGTKHIKSGDPYYMFKTENYLRMKKKEFARSQFKKINIR